MSRSSWKTLPDVREALSNVWECLVGPPGCPGGPLRCLGVFGRPSWMSESSGEALPDVWEWSGGPLESLGGPP